MEEIIKKIYFAGGCFWGTEHFFKQIKGVLSTKVGYANGKTENPTYQQVCKENTGHAETVEVVYNAEVVGLKSLLKLYYETIDPTSLNRQGGDVGVQYRTGIYYVDNKDIDTINDSISELERKYVKQVEIEVKALDNFYDAEDYHQNYLEKNTNGYCHINPELFEMAKKFVEDK